MGKRNKVTTRDIAQATNVSQSTVSMILSENKNVSFKEETVNLVKKTAKQMGYKKPEVKKRYSNAKNTIVVRSSTRLSTASHPIRIIPWLFQASLNRRVRQKHKSLLFLHCEKMILKSTPFLT